MTVRTEKKALAKAGVTRSVQKKGILWKPRPQKNRGDTRMKENASSGNYIRNPMKSLHHFEYWDNTYRRGSTAVNRENPTMT